MSDILPIKALPSVEAQNKKILELGVWLDGLLSLQGDMSAKRLEILLPMIKDSAWSMSINDIKKAFTMYVKSELNLEPRDNYLTIILFNRVMKEYKNTQRAKPEKFDEDEYKKAHDKVLAIMEFDYFIHNNKVSEHSYWVYTFLESLGLIADSAKKKKNIKKLVEDEPLKRSNEEVIYECKRRLLEQYFNRLNAKDQHLKDLV